VSAAIAIVAGLTLLVFELRVLWRGGGGEAWFWMVVAVLLVAVGVAQWLGLTDRSDDSAIS